MSDAPELLLAHHLRALKLPTFLREHDKRFRQDSRHLHWSANAYFVSPSWIDAFFQFEAKNSKEVAKNHYAGASPDRTNTDGCATASTRTTRRGLRPWHVRTLLAREPGDLALDQRLSGAGPHRKGEEP